MGNFFLQRFLSIKYALLGLKYVIQTQRNAWVHIIATILSISFGLWLQIPTTDLAILLLSIIVVWATEIINTAIECTVNLACPEKNTLAKLAKDISAAGVLVTAFGAILIGFLLLAPPLWSRMHLLLASN